MTLSRNLMLLCIMLLPQRIAWAEIPATRAVHDSARTKLEQAIANQGLRLSNSEERGSTRFSVVVTLFVPIKDLGTQITSYVVARDGDDVAILICSAKGSPFAYATRDLFCGFDLAQRGQLIMYEQGAPVILLGLSDADTGLDFDFSFRRDQRAPRVLLAIDDLLVEALRRSESVEFRGNDRSILVKTNKSDVWVMLTEKLGERVGAIAEVVFRSKAGPVISITSIRTSGERSSILGLRPVDFNSLGLPVIAGQPNGVSQIPLLVPRSFGVDEPERSASERVLRLLRMAPPAASPEPTTNPIPRDTRQSALNAAVGVEVYCD